jgi:hypothetical protein
MSRLPFHKVDRPMLRDAGEVAGTYRRAPASRTRFLSAGAPAAPSETNLARYESITS